MAKAVFLDFEKDLGEIYKKMEELENKELETGVSENEALSELKRKMRSRTAEIYADLTPWQTALVARHPNRPYTLDYIDAIFEDFHELHGDRTFIAPCALTVFVWVVLMNAIDLVPVDLLPAIAGLFGIHYLRPLPTADLNGTMGISIAVLLLSLYYGFKIKGAGGWFHELFSAPFGNHFLLWPFNCALNIIEYLAKTVSLGMRLFGNMYAGELLFFLIALLGGYAMSFGVFGGSLSVFGQIFAGLCWWLFHILIVLLQAFIMMMLTLVYIGQAHDGH